MRAKARTNRSTSLAGLTPHIRWCAVDDIIVVLDISRGEYFALDSDTSRDWKLLCEGDRAPSAAFLKAIDARGWLGAGEAQPRQPRDAMRMLARGSRHLLAFACIVLARWRLRRHGFAGAYGWAQAWGAASGTAGRRVERDLRPFLAAEALMPSLLGERDCLPRSLALFVYLRALGHDVRHVIGVARFPFSAHAWVETGQTTLLERPIEQKLLPGARVPKGRIPIAVIA